MICQVTIVSDNIRDQPNSRSWHFPWNWPSSVKNAHFRVSVKFREIRDFLWILTLLLSFMKGFRVLSTAFYADFAVCYVSHFSTKQLAYIHLLTSSLESWLSTLITIINIRCSEISNVLFDSLVCINIAPRNNGCPWISQTPFVNFPWNLAHFKNSTVKSRIFSRELGWSLDNIHCVSKNNMPLDVC